MNIRKHVHEKMEKLMNILYCVFVVFVFVFSTICCQVLLIFIFWLLLRYFLALSKCDVDSNRVDLPTWISSDEDKLKPLLQMFYSPRTSRLTATEYLYHRWPRVCSLYRFHSPVLSSSGPIAGFVTRLTRQAQLWSRNCLSFRNTCVNYMYIVLRILVSNMISFSHDVHVETRRVALVDQVQLINLWLLNVAFFIW